MLAFSPQRKAFLFSLATGIGVCLLHFARLSAHSFPSGWDAYFYLIQVKAMVEEGSMHSPDSSPIYPLLKEIYLLCGEYELSFQLLCSLLAGVFSVLLLQLLYRSRASWWLLLVGALWCISSPSLAYFAANFPKNLLGVCFLLLLFLAVQQRNTWLAVPALLLAGLSHRLSAGLAGIWLGGRYLYPWGWIVLSAGTILLLMVSILVPGLFHLSDLARFSGSFTSQINVPHLNFIVLQDLWGVQAHWALEILCLGGLFLLSLWRGFRNRVFRDPHQRALLVLFGLLFLPFWEIDASSMGTRFFLVGLLLNPLCLAWLWSETGLRGVLVLLFSLGAFWSIPQNNPQVFDPDYAYYQYLSQRCAPQFDKQRPELIIAHNGLAEVITFYQGIDALPWLPEYEIAPDQLYRLAFGIQDYEIEAVLGRPLEGQPLPLGFSYLLLLEKDWQAFVEKTKTKGDEELLERIEDWKNPSQIRPTYLLRNKSPQ